MAARLPSEGPQHVVVLAGSLLVWHGLRESTRGVDSLRPLDAGLAQAADEVGAAHGLAAAWLNARAASFSPLTLDVEDCTALLDHPRLQVLGAPLDQVFLMKLYAARDRDLDDLRALWPPGSSPGVGSVSSQVRQWFARSVIPLRASARCLIRAYDPSHVLGLGLFGTLRDAM